MTNESPIEYECDDILTLLKAFPGRIFERHSIQKGLDLGISSFHDVRLKAAGVDVIDGQPMRYRWPTTIHPPAHYQIDTSTPGWNTRYVDAVAKEHGWTRAEAQGWIADGGAG